LQDRRHCHNSSKHPPTSFRALSARLCLLCRPRRLLRVSRRHYPSIHEPTPVAGAGRFVRTSSNGPGRPGLSCHHPMTYTRVVARRGGAAKPAHDVSCFDMRDGPIIDRTALAQKRRLFQADLYQIGTMRPACRRARKGATVRTELRVFLQNAVAKHSVRQATALSEANPFRAQRGTIAFDAASDKPSSQVAGRSGHRNGGEFNHCNTRSSKRPRIRPPIAAWSSSRDSGAAPVNPPTLRIDSDS
jgi:hypothetical protein